MNLAVVPVMPVLPGLPPFINPDVQYRKLLVGTFGEVPGSTGLAVLSVLLPELLPVIIGNIQNRELLTGTNGSTSGPTSGYKNGGPVPNFANRYFRSKSTGTTGHVVLTRESHDRRDARGPEASVRACGLSTWCVRAWGCARGN